MQRVESTRTAAVDHDRRVAPRTRLLNRGRGGLDVLRGKVGALGAAAQNDVDVLVPAGLDDRSEPLLGHSHERVRVRARAHCVNRNGDLSCTPSIERR